MGACFVSIALAYCPAKAANWPTYLHDNHRNAVTSEKLAPPLSLVWVHSARYAPQSAWPAPAKQDFYHGGRRLDPRAIFDRAYQVVVASGSLYYASPANHEVYCLDVGTGKVQWGFFAAGPVRLAPTIWEDKVYFGSDDGWVYCLSARDGALVWKYRPGPGSRLLPGNGHVISLWPVRSGVLIEGNIAYACAGLFPDQGVYLCALEANSGKELWKKKVGCSSQGYLVTAGGRLFVPTGRTGPAVFERESGKSARGNLSGASGTYLVATGDKLFFQRTHYQRSLGVAGTTYTHPADFVVLKAGVAYFHGKRDISALNFDHYPAWREELDELESRRRKIVRQDPEPSDSNKQEYELDKVLRRLDELEKKLEACLLWKRMPGMPSYSFILAGDVLFSGRDGEVVAISIEDGKEVWSGQVSGKAYGLAAAQGRLFVSTDKGKIYCFMPGRRPEARQVAFATEASPYPKDARTSWCARTAEAVVEAVVRNLTTRKGYCLVLGFGEGRLAYEIARRTDFKVVGVEADGEKVERAREVLDQAGLYGRIVVHHGSLEKLPYPKYFANLIVLDGVFGNGKAAVSPTEVYRVLRPYGGVVAIVQPEGTSRLEAPEVKKWMKQATPGGGAIASSAGLLGVIRRGVVPGAGEWTHQYADPSNVACSRDELTGDGMELLWFGDPGPRSIIDRHNRTMAPLVKEGRLFVPANERIIALDPYNGTRLWSLEVPGSRRVGVLKDSGHMVVSDDYVYIVVKDKCWAVNVKTGKREFTLALPQLVEGEKREWGYIAVAGDQVFGTGQRPGASFNEHRNMCPILEGDFRLVIISEYLFSLDRKSGREQWHYRKGAIFNSGIAMGGGRLYFIESRNQEATAENKTGRMRIDKFLGGENYLVALEAQTGKTLWQTPVRLPFEHIVYLCYANDIVLAVGTFNRSVAGSARAHYGLRAYYAATGEPRWSRDFSTRSGPGGSHGEQWQHPVIIGDEVFAKYYACNLQTGEPLRGWKFSGGGGCGNLSASSSLLCWRGGSPQIFNLNTDQRIRLNRVNRPGCFINIIPAGGIISIPESSAGCTCNYPLQTSLAYVPGNGLKVAIHPFYRQFTDRVTVTLHPVIEGVCIRYTLDGSDPTENSTLYVEPFELTRTTTVKTRLWGAGESGRTVVLATFTKR